MHLHSRYTLLTLAGLLWAGIAGAASISSDTCSSTDTTGCVTSYMAGYPAMAVQVTGTWSGTVEFLGSNDNSTFTALRGYPVAGGAYVTSTTANGAWTVPTGGMKYLRIRGQSWVSGTAEVALIATTTPVVVDVVRATGLSTEALLVGLTAPSLKTWSEVQASGTRAAPTLASDGLSLTDADGEPSVTGFRVVVKATTGTLTTACTLRAYVYSDTLSVWATSATSTASGPRYTDWHILADDVGKASVVFPDQQPVANRGRILYGADGCATSVTVAIEAVTR